MIAIHHSETGEIQIVGSLDGYGNDWAVIADPAPADIDTVPYQIVAGELVPDIAPVRAKQRAIINAARDAAQDGGCETPSGRFDTSERSKQFLNGAVTTAVLAAMNNQAFTINWTLENNSVVALTGPQIMAAGAAVALHIDTMHQRAVLLKSRIDAATTVAAITAIGWSLADPA